MATKTKKTAKQLEAEISAALGESSLYFPGGDGGGGGRRGGGTAIVLPHARTSASCRKCGQYHTAAEHERHGGAPVRARPTKTKTKVKTKTKAKAKAKSKPSPKSTSKKTSPKKTNEKAKSRAGSGSRSAPTATTHAPPTPVVHQIPLNTESIIKMVLEKAPKIKQVMTSSSGFSGRQGDKVFIGSIWQAVSSDPRMRGITRHQFNRALIDANRMQVIDLARSDVRGNVDADELTNSEISDMGADFHFVNFERRR
jgi:hypothetical protein